MAATKKISSKHGLLGLTIGISVSLFSICSYGSQWIPKKTGKVVHTKINEASGIAVSRKQTGVIWTHNDSGDKARIFAMRSDGEHAGEYILKGAHNRDYEDIAIGPGPKEGVDYLYVGDIGDNDSTRRNITVYRFPEPLVSIDNKSTYDVDSVEKIHLRYPDHAHDAETLMVDPRTGDLLVGTKRGEKFSLFKVTQDEITKGVSETIPMTLVISVVEPKLDLFGIKHMASAGDISPDGSIIAVRGYGYGIFWERGEGQTIADAMRGKSRSMKLAEPVNVQGESLGFDDKNGFYTLSEGVGQTIYYYQQVAEVIEPTSLAGEYTMGGILFCGGLTGFFFIKKRQRNGATE